MKKTRKNGFTLIELLAVIVVLAILALIAVPIVLNIIKDARNNSNKRSIESYARAIDYAVSEYMSENPDQEIVTWDDVKYKVEYKGKVECQWGENLSSISQAGEITLHGCKVNNKTNITYQYVKGKVTEEKTEEDNNKEEIVYSAYNVGDEITYKGMKFYVIAPSDTKTEYVTLLKETPLTVDEVNTYGGVGTSNNHVNMYNTSNTSASDYQKAYNNNGYGGMAYYSSATCGYNGSSWVYDGCTNEYDKSEIKYVVDAWSNSKLTQKDLKEVEGYTVRLLTIGELTTNLGYEVKTEGTILKSTNGETPSWIYDYKWVSTMSSYDDSTKSIWYIDSNPFTEGYVHSNTDNVRETFFVRPVINLKKSSIK